jgi:poly-beta-hydroxyalkanoate depolymerase
MIYQLHEFQKTVMAPTVLLADTVKHLFTNPFSPLAYTPVSRTIAANSEVFVRLMRRYPKPQWQIDHSSIDGERIAVTREVAVEKPFCQLLHFRKDPAVVQPKLLIVAPLSGHFATLLRDTVRTALPDHDVWVTEWVDAKMVPLSKGPFHLNDYVDYIREFIRHLSPDLNVMSVCQPTVPVLAAVSLMAAENTCGAEGDDHDGRADRHPPQSDHSERFCLGATALVVRRQGNHARAAELSGLHAQGVPGLPATRQFPCHESGPPPGCAQAVLQPPDPRRR